MGSHCHFCIQVTTGDPDSRFGELPQWANDMVSEQYGEAQTCQDQQHSNDKGQVEPALSYGFSGFRLRQHGSLIQLQQLIAVGAQRVELWLELVEVIVTLGGGFFQ